MLIHWQPSIGDPTLVGWFTVVMYLVAATLSGWAANHTKPGADRWKSQKFFWLCVCAVSLALGVNKHLDLQSLLTEIGRAFAKRDGWYDDRYRVQKAFIVSVLLAAMLLIGLSAVWLRSMGRPIQIAAGGVFLVVAFVVIRAASFHHVDLFLSQSFLAARWNWILELSGISIVIIAALSFIALSKRQRRRRRPA